jgi:hypothetical protein
VGDDVDRSAVLGGQSGNDDLEVVGQLRERVAAGPGARSVTTQVDRHDEPVLDETGCHLGPVRRVSQVAWTRRTGGSHRARPSSA